jgi:hypothetical protein
LLVVSTIMAQEQDMGTCDAPGFVLAFADNFPQLLMLRFGKFKSFFAHVFKNTTSIVLMVSRC